jgi:hypothetical protein
VPIVLTSRADTAETRIASCVIAALIAHANARTAAGELIRQTARGGSDREPYPGAGGSPEDGARLPDARPSPHPQANRKKDFASQMRRKTVISRLFRSPRPALWITTSSYPVALHHYM